LLLPKTKYSVLGPVPVIEHPFEKKSGLPNSSDVDLSLRLVIPKIGVDAPIVLTQYLEESMIQKELEKGVVRYPDSNTILGHSSAYPWYQGNFGSIFSLLNKLEGGDELFIFSGDKKFIYTVTDKKIDLPKNLNLEEDDKTLYLVSCWPISTAWKRIAVKAVLTNK